MRPAVAVGLAPSATAAAAALYVDGTASSRAVAAAADVARVVFVRSGDETVVGGDSGVTAGGMAAAAVVARAGRLATVSGR